MSDGDDLRRSLENLAALGKTPDVNIRPVLLRVLVDLFVRKTYHSPAEMRQFEEITQRLLDEADDETRLIVADKLSRHPATPRTLFDRFLTERGQTASRVLEHASVASDMLLAAATWGTLDMAMAVARRADLDTAVARALAERPEREILLVLVDNRTAPFDRSLVQYLARRARGDEEVSLLLLKRECEPADLAPFFLLASSERRTAILASACRDDLGPESRRPRLSAEEGAALMRVERALMASDQDSFDVALAAALKIPLSDAWSIIDDRRGEPLAVALAAIGASPEFAARVFILSGPAIGHSVMAVRTLTKLVEDLPMRTARRIVAVMTGAPARYSRGRTFVEAETDKPRRYEPEARRIHPVVAPLQRRLQGGRPS